MTYRIQNPVRRPIEHILMRYNIHTHNPCNNNCNLNIYLGFKYLCVGDYYMDVKTCNRALSQLTTCRHPSPQKWTATLG